MRSSGLVFFSAMPSSVAMDALVNKAYSYADLDSTGTKPSRPTLPVIRTRSLRPTSSLTNQRTMSRRQTRKTLWEADKSLERFNGNEQRKDMGGQTEDYFDNLAILRRRMTSWGERP